MSYAIFKIMFGVPMQTEDSEYEDDERLEDAFVNEEPGFHEFYSAGGEHYPRAFGIEVGEFDECVFSIDVSTLPLTVTQETIGEYAKLFDALHDEMKKVIQSFGEPRLFFLASSS